MTSEKAAYIAFCEQHPNIPLFLQPWWLDAVTQPDGKKWEAFVARNNQGEIEAVFPFLYGSKLGLRYALTPQLTQYTGIWILDKEGETTSARLSREKKLQNDIIAQIDSLRLSFFDVRFPLSYQYWSPLYWAGYHQETHYTYRIENLSNIEQVYENLDYAKQKQIRKAQEAGITIDFTMTADELYDLQCLQLDKRGSKDVLSRALVQSVVTKSRACGQGLIARAKDSEGNTHAAIFVVWDGNCAWELISAIHPKFRASGASTLVVWETMRHLSQTINTWDFEGSMIEGVENSFRQFGGKPVPYFTIQKTNKLIRIFEACKK
ncbi:MAG: GNAT family N-acetyltransferase [Paludibacteraceae bacterium]|nr:GNAT family N-acetyltransferase [Paludibacteraceae bacterium]